MSTWMYHTVDPDIRNTPLFCSRTSSISIHLDHQPEKWIHCLRRDLRLNPMKAKVRGRYDAYQKNASAALSVNVGQELILRATMSDATFVHGPSLTGLQLSLHKPNSFTLHYDLPEKEVGFQFTNKVALMDKIVQFTYTHAHGGNHTAMEGSMAIDSANRVGVGYDFGTENWKVKYVYAHGLVGRTVMEPCYDVSNNSWDFAVSRRLDGGDSVKATYHTASKDLGLEWKRRSKANGSFKISASLNLAEQCKVPKIKAESTWCYEI